MRTQEATETICKTESFRYVYSFKGIEVVDNTGHVVASRWNPGVRNPRCVIETGFSAPTNFYEGDISPLDSAIVFDRDSKSLLFVEGTDTIDAIIDGDKLRDVMKSHELEAAKKIAKDAGKAEQHMVHFFFELPTTAMLDEGTRYWTLHERFIGPTLEKARTRDFFRTGGIISRYLTAVLDAFYAARPAKASCAMGENAVKLAREFAELNPAHMDCRYDAETSIKGYKLRSLLRHPEFLLDEAALPVLEELADVKHSVPWEFEMYHCYADRKYHLKKGIKKEHIDAFAKFIDSDRLWTGESEEMRRVFFSSVAMALESLAQLYPVETFGPRVRLMEKSMSHEDHSGVLENLVYTFRTPGEKAGLKAVAEAKAGTPLAERAEKILAGGYDNTMWC